MDLTGPGAWEADAVLRDGRTVHLRSIRPDDAPLVIRFHERQSQESIYFRFFSPRPRLSDRELRHFTTVDHRDRVAFVALVDDELIGVARYERYEGTDTAEVAFFVDDDHHGRGLATLMLEYLAAAARENGIRRFRATTLPNNRKMLGVFAAAGYEVATQLDDGIVEVAFDLQPTEEVVAAVQHRERVAEAASVRRMLWPSTVAVVGCGPGGTGPAAAVARRISDGGFTGRLQLLDGDQVDDVLDGTDLVVLAGDDGEVLRALELCGLRSVGAAIVLTSMDAERSSELVDAARRHGMRLLGPGSPGVTNTDPDVRLHAMISAPAPPAGAIAMLTESGDAMTAIVDHVRRVELGISTLVALDVPTDLNAADALSFWADDPPSRAVLMYLGSSPLPSRFVPAARAASMSKPVIALRAASAESGGRRSRAIRCADAMLRQSGVITVPGLQDLFAIGRLLADQPAPSGRGVAVVGTSDGAVGVAGAACAAASLEPTVCISSSEEHGPALDVATADPRTRAVVVVDVTPGSHLPADLAAELLSASARRPDLTFAATTIGGARPVRLVDGALGVAVPVFTFPEHAAGAIARLATAAEWRATARVFGEDARGTIDAESARLLVERWVAEGVDASVDVELDHIRRAEVLEAAGIPLASGRVAHSTEEAVAAAESLGWPVVLKARRRDRRRRSVASGVALDLADVGDMHSAWSRMESILGVDAMRPALVQRLVEQGLDVGIRARRIDGVTTVEVGLGGPAAAFDPWQLGVVPLSLTDSGALVAASSVGRALTDPIDRVPVVSLVHRIASLMEAVDGVTVIHADPVIVAGPDAWITDVEVRIGGAGAAPAVRRLG